jgi:hypothetical protein
MVIIERNPFQHILTQWIINGKYSKWIEILEKINLELVSTILKKTLLFVELMLELYPNMVRNSLKMKQHLTDICFSLP